uniref:Midnolin n=1 Tax=Ornithodoros turicata TaxID=34597 RepID=A0A2R5L5A9_9ACAR
MQALESLSDAQVENFLCGRAPLHLTMRLGDHMIFVQLQLCAPPETPPATPTTPTCPTVPPEASAPRQQQSEGSEANSGNNPNNNADVASGAVIERMCHLGRGVYSGTFSGTLSPELQDREGRPRRHVTTILHILRDLLGASHPWRTATFSPGTSASASSPNPLATPPPTPPPTGGGTNPQRAPQQPPSPLVPTEEEHRLLRGKLDQIHATLRERRRARRSTPYGKASSDGTVLV